MSKIAITGKDIIEYDGKDHTGAFKELNFKFKSLADGRLDLDVCNREFYVDLDFVLRHGLMNDIIYKKYYKGSEQYKKYYNEGKQAFLDGKNDPLDNSYTDKKNDWLNDLQVKGYPWYEGYRETKSNFYEQKYKLEEMQNEIRGIVKKYGLEIEYSDEYCDPYAITPEGYQVKLA